MIDDRIRKRLLTLLSDVPLSSVADGHPKICERVSDARAAFLQGFREALKVSSEVLFQFLQNQPYQKHGFALEGAAMALALMDEFSPAAQSRLEIFLNGRSTEEQVLGAIGVGWASARLGKPFDWKPSTLGLQYISAVVDGYGFHQGIFHPLRFTGRGFPMAESKLTTCYDIGLGRALWFVHMGNVDPIVQAIDRFLPDRRKSLWRGVGTACAFTGSTEYIATQMRTTAAKYENNFQIGLAIGTQLLDNLAQHKEEIL